MDNTKSYDKMRPLERLEKGDKVYISVSHFPFSKEKDKKKYKDVPKGTYEGIYEGDGYVICKEYPVLNGHYNMWHGDKHGCSEGIYANEKKR